MSFTRSLVSFFLITGLLSAAFAQQPEQEGEFYPPLKVEFLKMQEAIEKLRTLGSFEPLDYLPPVKFNEPLIAPLILKPDVTFQVRQKFSDIQKFLFRDQTPFQLVFCEHCDVQPRINDKLIIYVDVYFMDLLIREMNAELVDLDLAHAFSHYLIERYMPQFSVKTPAGQGSKFFDLTMFDSNDPKPKLTYYGLISKDANYHAEIDAMAAAILLMMGKPVPDFSPVVELYRVGKLKRGKLNIPEHIYTDQEIRVNTLRWIRENWR